MEYILHYIWKYRLYSAIDLRTTENEKIEIIDTGIENKDSGPDFFNAKVIIEGTLWKYTRKLLIGFVMDTLQIRCMTMSFCI